MISQTELEAQVLEQHIATAGSISVAVQQGNPPVSSNTLTFTVVQGFAITTPCPLPNGARNQPYNLTLQAAGGAPPFAWSLAQGSLPPGLQLSAQGTIGGTPTAVITANFVLRVSDSQGQVTTRNCSLTITEVSAGQNLSIFSLAPTSVLAGSPGFTLSVNGTGFGTGATVLWNYQTAAETPLATTVVNAAQLAAAVPANLVLTPGQFPIGVRRPGSLTTPNQFSNAELFTVLEPLMITTNCPLPELSQGQQYSERMIVTGGFPGYDWDIATGALTGGLTLDRSGLLSGIAGTPGLYRFTLRATDSRGNQATRNCSQRVVGPLTVFPAALVFVADGNLVPPAQDLSLTSAGSRVPVQTTVATERGGPWLRASASGNETPALVLVVADPEGLAAGTYRGTITFTSERTSNRVVTVGVELRINPPQPARLGVRPSALRFTFPRGSSQPGQRFLEVFNQGAGSIPFTAEASAMADGRWLSLQQGAGTAAAGRPGRIRVEGNPAGLAPGVYRGRITVRGGSAELVVPVTMTISTSPESMLLSQSGLLFTAAGGGPVPPPKRFEVLAGGSNGFFWEASGSTLSGGGWLKVTPPSNSSRPAQPSSLEVAVDPAGLPPDLYFGEVQVKSAGVDNSPRLLSVVLRVLPPSTAPPPAIEPAGLVFTTVPGGALPPTKAVTVHNLSNSPAAVSAAVNSVPSVFSAGDTDVTILPPGGLQRYTILANTTGLAAGAYRGSLAIHVSSDPRVRLVDLLAVVGPGIPTAAAPNNARQAAGCVPNRLLPVATNQTVGFGAPTGLPLPIEVRVVDDCGDPMTRGAVTAALSPGSQPPAALVYLADGRWGGTLQVLANAGPVTATITADDPARNLQGTLTLTGEAAATDGVPVLSEGGVVSTASFTGEAPLAPGSLFAAFGSQLGTGSTVASGFPLPTLLGSTRVAIAGREAPLFFSGGSQVNGMLPYDLVPNASYQMSVRRGNRRSNYAEVALAGTQPSIFTADQSGTGQGIVVDGANPRVLVNAAAPIARGSLVVIYLEGLGAVNRAVAAGDPAPGGPLAEAVAPVTVTIGGQRAALVFAGLTPFFAGLYQINAEVPLGIAPGNAVPVVVTAGGQTSPPVTIAVR